MVMVPWIWISRRDMYALEEECRPQYTFIGSFGLGKVGAKAGCRASFAITHPYIIFMPFSTDSLRTRLYILFKHIKINGHKDVLQGVDLVEEVTPLRREEIAFVPRTSRLLCSFHICTSPAQNHWVVGSALSCSVTVRVLA